MNNVLERLEQLSANLAAVLSREKELQQNLQAIEKKLNNIIILDEKSSKTD